MSLRIDVKPLFLAAAALSAMACGPDERILKSGKETPAAPSANAAQTPAASTTEDELNAIRAADFRFVYVVRRKDGGVFSPEDNAAIRQATSDANRRVATDDGRAVIR